MNDAFASKDSAGRSRTATAPVGGGGFESSTGGENVVGGETNEEKEGGLVRLAQPDRDAHRAYCSLIPEWLRLEEIFVKGLLN